MQWVADGWVADGWVSGGGTPAVALGTIHKWPKRPYFVRQVEATPLVSEDAAKEREAAQAFAVALLRDMNRTIELRRQNAEDEFVLGLIDDLAA